ncbi:hypothetical protein DSUL_20543 [Desulfovibrionales bacterium]
MIIITLVHQITHLFQNLQAIYALYLKVDQARPSSQRRIS